MRAVPAVLSNPRIRADLGGIVLAALVCFVAGCSWIKERADTASAKRARDEAFAKFDVAQCTASGGKVQGVCMFGLPACVRKYSDAGKVCMDKSDCIGQCVQKEPSLSAGAQTTGVCEVSSDQCGCQSLVVAGRATQEVCWD
jgi:hypothetical protein